MNLNKGILLKLLRKIPKSINKVPSYRNLHEKPCSPSEHREEPYKIPSHREFDSIEHCPKLKELRIALAAKGLCDPWIRNEVWRFDTRNFGTQRQREFMFFRGFTYGLILAIISTLITKNLESKEHEDVDYSSYNKNSKCDPK